MQPSPIAETSGPRVPSLRFCIASPHLQVRAVYSGCGIPILPIYCLFLLRCCSTHKPRGYHRVEETEAVTVKNQGAHATPRPDRARELRAELAGKIALFVGSAEIRATEIPGLSLYRRTSPTAPCSMTYEPGVTVIAQGRKRVELGRAVFIYDSSRYLLTSLDLPVVSRVIEASESVPCLALSLKLEMP